MKIDQENSKRDPLVVLKRKMQSKKNSKLKPFEHLKLKPPWKKNTYYGAQNKSHKSEKNNNNLKPKTPFISLQKIKKHNNHEYH